MSVLAQFDPPGNLGDLSVPAGRAAWSTSVQGLFQDAASQFPQFFDPTATPAATGQATRAVRWAAFPATVLTEATTERQRWQIADGSRDRQDEYCEWSVERDGGGKVVRVTFTSETPEYFAQLMESDPAVLLQLYEQLTGHSVTLDDLSDGRGRYLAKNPFNSRTDRPIVHLAQASNTLGAAVQLAAAATVLRVGADGRPVESQQQLIRCGDLGVETRNSDPQIAAAVNQLAAAGLEISLANPPGLYLDGIITAGMKTPDASADAADPASFWTIERGDEQHTLRARFEVPAEHGFAVGDIEIGGRPIEFGAQLADRVRVKILAVAQPGTLQQRQPCV